MPIGVGADQEALRRSARDLLDRTAANQAARRMADGEPDGRPPGWPQMADLGWLALPVPEEHGGAGAGLAELVVVLEELGRFLVPGPFVPTALAVLLADRAGGGDRPLLPGLLDGSSTAAVACTGRPLDAVPAGGGLKLAGSVGPVLGAGSAELLLLPATSSCGAVWCLLDAADARVGSAGGLDPTRRLAEVEVAGVSVGADRVFPALAVADPAAPEVPDPGLLDLAAVLFAAECCGLAGWCLDTAVAHARTRVQFGRPIGAFQAVKHRLADLLLAVEQARAVTWDAARALDAAGGRHPGADPGWAARPGGPAGRGTPAEDRPPATAADARLAALIAGTVAPDVALRAAKDTVQVLGGIGFTWEHDVHLYLKRAAAVRQLLSPGRWRDRAARLALDGVRRPLDLQLPPEAEQHRREVRSFVSGLAGLDGAQRRRAIVDAGYLAPHWPRPWGRAAGPVEQVVVDEEFRRAGVNRPGLAVAAWVVPTLIAHGTAEQQQRWLPRTLAGEYTWCQLFSEPGAGSDLAALSTRATPTAGGWLISGQKVWTSMADRASHAILLARTGPPTESDRRAGISFFVLDMHHDGVDVRPLRELTGQSLFNEVFLTDAFVPDGSVVGAVGDGWRVARATLANERVSMSSGATFGAGIEALLAAARDRAGADPVLRDRLGELVAEAHALGLLGFRSTLRALSGGDPAPEASLRKLLSGEHEQRVQETGLSLLGPAGAAAVGPAAGWANGFLFTRCLTIAGGTSEVQRNVVAERLLGLPRDDLPVR